MSGLLRTRDDAYYYLIEKRDEIRHMAQQAQDLGNTDGAKILFFSAVQLTENIKQLMPTSEKEL